MTATNTVATPDGRTLFVESGGDPLGRAVFALPGVWGGRRLITGTWLEEDIGTRGVHLLSYDRPGYGGSTVQTGRTIADAARDVRTIADALGIDRLAVWGHSGGGPCALACAALLPDLVCAAATFACIVPYNEPWAAFFEGMPEGRARYWRMVVDDPNAFREARMIDRDKRLALTPEQIDALGSEMPPSETFPLSYFRSTYEMSIDAVTPGVEGVCEDMTALCSDWGFRVDDIKVPVQLWHGMDDYFRSSQLLAGRIPGADLKLVENEGHMAILYHHYRETQEWLLQHF
jgi:pimeloyl-ACP methyl ester carboxylesterase